MNKLIVVFNTCGISGRENVKSYLSSITNILNQSFYNFRVVFSSCMNSHIVRSKVFDYFGNYISYNFVDDLLPVNITFNHSVMKAVENMGEAEGYLYIDSGVDFQSNVDVLKTLYNLHKSDSYGMTASRVNTDAGTFLWFKEGANQQDESGQEKLLEDGDFVIPVGKTTNLHVQIFDNEIRKAYNGRILPDIFASHCTESTFSFLNASINKKFVLSKETMVHHETSMDGASSGFRPEYSGGPGWRHLLPFSHKTIDEIISNPEAKECGFGYEECQNILMHSPDKFGENGYAKDPERLRKFILENIYLPESHFDYDKINHTFIA